LWSRSLLLSWAVVACALAAGWCSRHRQPDLGEALRLLADGDLDGDERGTVLRRIQQLALSATDPTARWASWLASIALEERGLGPSPATAPPAADLPFLDLGDPVLGHVIAASLAELAGDRAQALQRWQAVERQGWLSSRIVARELAAEASRRLR
jgi:hypothetical protein